MKQRLWRLPAMLCALVFLNCDDWHVWDDLFARHPPAGTRAWTGGDGGVSVSLPNDRTLWIFGDSFVNELDANGNRVALDQLANIVFGNTIAVQAATSTPDPAQMRFYARSGSSVAEVTSAPATGGYGQFFNHAFFGLTPPSGLWGLWPVGGTCLDCTDGTTSNDRLLVTMAEVVSCNPSVDSTCILPLCNPPSSSCTTGIKISATISGAITNPSASPSSWSVAPGAMRVASDLIWGTAYMLEGGTLYIYGHDSQTQTKLYVARVAAGSVLDRSAWSYRTAAGWQTFTSAPSASQLSVVASGVGTLASVHKVTRRGLTRYLLVYDHPLGDHFVYFRVSTTLDAWPAVDARTPKADLASIDSSIFWVQLAEAAKPGSTCVNTHFSEQDYRACAMTYHGRAHPNLPGDSDSHGPVSLIFGYIVPHDPAGGVTHSGYYRPKFGSLDYDKLAPWCTAAGQPCWEGIGRQFPQRAIAQGATVTYVYDVTAAAALGTPFRADIVYGSGNPDLYVRFGAPPTTSSFHCASTTAGTQESCSLTVPSNQTTAYVMVRGVNASNYSLRVNYAGD